MTLTQRNDIALPANGLMVYQTNNTPGFYFYNGSAWELLLTSATSSGDNLGNHTATQAFNLGNYSITNASTISLTSTSSTIFGFNRFDAGSTVNDQMRVTVNGNSVFGILGDGRVNTTSNILMVNNATVDRVDLSEMIGISGSHLGTFTGNILSDDLSIKEALQVVENVLMALESASSATAIDEESIPLEKPEALPKFSANHSGNIYLAANKKNIISYKDIKLDTRTGLTKNGYRIPESGTYFIQFRCSLKGIEGMVKENFISILNNGNEISRASFLINNSNGMGTVSVFDTYKKGDLVQASISLNSEIAVLSLNDSATSFSGFLVK